MNLNSYGNNYEHNLLNATEYLKGQAGSLVSIKVRPIDKMPVSDQDEFWDAYVYSDEYQNINAFLAKNQFVGTGSVNYGQTAHCANLQGEEFLFVEHETGPEIIASLALITASLTLGKSIIEMITAIIKTINDSNEKKKKGEPSGRYHEAKAISVEKRTEKETKILKIIQLPALTDEISLAELKKLLDEF